MAGDQRSLFDLMPPFTVPGPFTDPAWRRLGQDLLDELTRIGLDARAQRELLATTNVMAHGDHIAAGYAGRIAAHRHVGWLAGEALADRDDVLVDQVHRYHRAAMDKTTSPYRIAEHSAVLLAFERRRAERRRSEP